MDCISIVFYLIGDDNLAIKSQEVFEEEINKKYKGRLTVLSKYTGSHNKVDYLCSDCGSVYSAAATQLISKYTPEQGCRLCSHKRLGEQRRKPHSKFLEEVSNVNTDVTVIGKYVDWKTKINVLCNLCNVVYMVSPNNLLRGRKCPHCGESKGESAVKDFLEYFNIQFEQEYSFPNLIGVGENPLRFDFCIVSNSKVIGAIEYDGEFHFHKFFEDQNFETLKIHDKRKDEYCKDNHIPLLRIPYWDFDDIGIILEEWFALIS